MRRAQHTARESLKLGVFDLFFDIITGTHNQYGPKIIKKLFWPAMKS